MDETQHERAERVTRKKRAWEKWREDGENCYFVAFHDPVPTGKDKEPVGEFRVETKDAKYRVDKMIYTPYGLIFLAHGEIDIVGLSNVKLARFIT